VVSSVERELLRREIPDARVHIVSNIHTTHTSNVPFGARAGILFVGAFPHHPNADAMEYFFAETYPLLRGKLHAPITIIGSQPPAWLTAMNVPQVRVAGHVSDLESYWNQARLTIAPLRYGAGVKGKVLQSMSYGVPVVATSVAAEGLHAQDRRDLLLADDAPRFADAVCELYGDETLWNELAANGMTLVQKHFSPEAARAALRNLFADLVRA
jgi:glycosyltransferase involved in cell wall biosynthesis